MGQAQKNLNLAFPGQTIKLQQEFQMDENADLNVGALLAWADIILSFLKDVDNQRALRAKGWTDGDTQAFCALSDRPSDTCSNSTRVSCQRGSEEKSTTAQGHKQLNMPTVL